MQSLADALTAVRPTDARNPGERAWLAALRDAIRTPQELCEALGLPDTAAFQSNDFPTLVPRGFVARMRPGDPNDPLLLQVLPKAAESSDRVSTTDAVGDLAASLQPGLIQKYHGRALLITSGNCAVNCRYCFRRHFPYDSAPRSQEDWSPAFAQLASDPSLHEVILSGGDPLLLSDRRLIRLIERIESLPHIQTLRIHSRLPVVIPERVTPEIVAKLRSSRLRNVVVLHTNHANEIDATVAHAVTQLQQAGCLLLNQSVLLRGVNDSADALVDLSNSLLSIGVMPYYLHQIDRVAGVGHFEVPQEEGVAILRELRTRLPGYATPRYVREDPGAPHKTPLA